MKRKTRLSEILSVGFVRFSAIFTIASLILILGYIVWNGFYFSNLIEYGVLSKTETEINGVSLIVNKDIHQKELPFTLVRNLFADEYTNWKKVDGQGIDLFPYVSDDALEAVPAALAVDEVGMLVEYPGSTEKAVRAVAAKKGGAALVDAKAFASLDPSVRRSVKLVKIRPVALSVSPDVVELRDNHRVGTIEESAIADLFAGQIANWDALNGSDIPVTVIEPPDGTYLADVARDILLARKAKKTDAASSSVPRVKAMSLDEYYALLSSTSGAVGIVMANRATADKMPTLQLSRRESGQNLKLSFILEPTTDSGKYGGISSIILNTFAMIALTLLFSIPPGIFAAIYLVEYAREGRLLRIIRLGTETLAGVPSIIFGLFGMLVFVQTFGWGISLLSGSLTVTLMILPTIVRTAEEALKAIPRSLQEGSLALGATKVQTIFRVVLPAAFPAIASGVILAIGRALGETAALLYTMGSNYKLTSGLFDSTRTLAVHIYLIIAEGISTDRAFSSATVLVFFILAINTAARLLIGRVGRMSRA